MRGPAAARSFAHTSGSPLEHAGVVHHLATVAEPVRAEQRFARSRRRAAPRPSRSRRRHAGRHAEVELERHLSAVGDHQPHALETPGRWRSRAGRRRWRRCRARWRTGRTPTGTIIELSTWTWASMNPGRMKPLERPARLLAHRRRCGRWPPSGPGKTRRAMTSTTFADRSKEDMAAGLDASAVSVADADLEAGDLAGHTPMAGRRT